MLHQMIMEKMLDPSLRTSLPYLSRCMAKSEAGSLTNNYEFTRTSEHQTSFEVVQTIRSSRDLTDTVSTAQGEASKGYELDPTRKDMDVEERRRLRKRQQNTEADREFKLRKKLELEELQEQVKAISRETSSLTKNMIRYSEECRALKYENKALLEELRKVCDKETISRLESLDPCHEFSDDETENSSQSQQSSYESDGDTSASPSLDQIAVS